MLDESDADTDTELVGMMQSVGPAAFINYPFIPESVALLANYTRTANELGMVCSVPTTHTCTRAFC